MRIEEQEEQEEAREQRKDEPSLGLGRWGRRAAGLGGWQHSAEDAFGETTKPLRNRISAGNHLLMEKKRRREFANPRGG